MATEINWDAPIEAVHEDGRVVAVTLVKYEFEPDGKDTRRVEPAVDLYSHWFHEDGTRWDGGWAIRNRATTPTPDERAVALVKLMAIEPIRAHQSDGIQQAIYEARAIVAALEPVDRVEAKRLAGIWEIDEEAAYQILARGRQLEKEGK